MLLLQQVIQSLASVIVILAILLQIVITNRKLDIGFDSMLLIPGLDLILIETSLHQLLVGLQIQHCRDLAILHHLIDINLIQWIATNDDIVLSALLNDLVEEETVEERAIRFLDNAVDDLHRVFALEVRGRGDLGVAELTLVGVRVLNEESAVRGPLLYLEAADLLFFAVGIGEVSVVVLVELSFAVTVLVLKWDYAFPELIRLTVF